MVKAYFHLIYCPRSQILTDRFRVILLKMKINSRPIAPFFIKEQAVLDLW
jgi:hypothetical protein